MQSPFKKVIMKTGANKYQLVVRLSVKGPSVVIFLFACYIDVTSNTHAVLVGFLHSTRLL